MERGIYFAVRYSYRQKTRTMIRYTTLLLASIFALSGCNKNDPTPPFTQEQQVMETRNLKISPDDWEPYGIPGDDTHGYAATATSPILDQTIVSEGLVQLHLQRSNGGWLPLPATIEQGAPDGMNWRFTYYPNGIRITLDRNGAKVTPPDVPLVFRLSVNN